MSRRRYPRKVRREQILEQALLQAIVTSYREVTRRGLAEACEVTESAIQYHFPTMPQLRRAIMRHAVQVECLPVIAQGLAVKDPAALRAEVRLKERAASILL